ncbi:speriolin-like isoform X2 [Pseudophryne corroboree]|uniref:speriolin-like isoform X2 n=1 Tax=Pseudophryne corroboree TaxID=495146 RepID=UPI003081AE50
MGDDITEPCTVQSHSSPPCSMQRTPGRELSLKMSSLSSENSSIEIPKVQHLKQENAVIAKENMELYKMLILTQQNLMYRYTLRQHEFKVRNLSPPRRQHKASQYSKEMNNSNDLTDSSDSEDVKALAATEEIKEPDALPIYKPEEKRQEAEPLPSNNIVGTEEIKEPETLPDYNIDGIEEIKEPDALPIYKPEEKRQEAEPLPSNNTEGITDEVESLSLHADTEDIRKKSKPLAWHKRSYMKIVSLLGSQREKKEDPESLSLHESRKLPPAHRIIGEIGFQLEKRILSAVFQDDGLYGHYITNIGNKILQHSTCELSGQVNDELRATMTQRYKDLVERLRTLGYDPIVHVPFTEDLVNRNGIVKELPDVGTEERTLLTDLEYLRGIINDCVPGDMLPSVHVLLNCLALLAQEDGKPLFIWQ